MSQESKRICAIDFIDQAEAIFFELVRPSAMQIALHMKLKNLVSLTCILGRQVPAASLMFSTAFARQATPSWVDSSAWQKIIRSKILWDCPFKTQTGIETELFEERCSKIDRNNYPISTRKKVSFWYIFWRVRVCWPLPCLCRPFCIFRRCLDSNQRAAHSKQARYQLSHPSPR